MGGCVKKCWKWILIQRSTSQQSDLLRWSLQSLLHEALPVKHYQKLGFRVSAPVVNTCVQASHYRGEGNVLLQRVRREALMRSWPDKWITGRLQSKSKKKKCACAPSMPAAFLCEADEWIWMSSCGEPPSHCLMLRLSFSVFPLCVAVKTHQQERKEEKTWLPLTSTVLKISAAASCFHLQRGRRPEKTRSSTACPNESTCCPTDRECRLGSHVSFFSCRLLSQSPEHWLRETVESLMCLCWGHKWCHQLHCHVYMTHWVPDTHRIH